MKIIFIGTVEFSRKALEKVISIGGNIVGVCTLKNSLFNSDFNDLTEVACKKKIPVKYVDDINSQDCVEWISYKKPDVIFCFGWSQILKERMLHIAPLGVIGFHPAALPYNRGRHPIIWALVLGLKETASTFFFMDSKADSGDILSQRSIAIDYLDDARSLYDKVVNTALKQIEEFFFTLENGSYLRIKQNHSLANLWRKRGKEDGIIDWRMSADGIYNLVRGLARPYVGAHFEHNQIEYKVWQAEVVECYVVNIEPGNIINFVAAGIPVVKCGSNALKLIEVQPKLDAELGKYL